MDGLDAASGCLIAILVFALGIGRVGTVRDELAVMSEGAGWERAGIREVVVSDDASWVDRWTDAWKMCLGEMHQRCLCAVKVCCGHAIYELRWVVPHQCDRGERRLSILRHCLVGGDRAFIQHDTMPFFLVVLVRTRRIGLLARIFAVSTAGGNLAGRY